MYEITLKGAMRGLAAKFFPADGKPIVKGKVHQSKKQRLRERWAGREEERFGKNRGTTACFSSAQPNLSQVPSKTIM